MAAKIIRNRTAEALIYGSWQETSGRLVVFNIWIRRNNSRRGTSRKKIFAIDRIKCWGNGQIRYEKNNSNSVGSDRRTGLTVGAANPGAGFFDLHRGPALLPRWRLLARGILLGLGAGTLQPSLWPLGSGAL